jgi:ammonia channel protein AmtB
MEDKETKYLDDLSRKVIMNTTIERPSFNFTDSVMSQVNALQENKATVYKPLISKTSWVLIGFGVLALILYILFFGTKTETSNWIQSLDFSVFTNINMDVLPSLSTSKIFTYAFLFFGLMFCIQIPLLKNHFNKRFEA